MLVDFAFHCLLSHLDIIFAPREGNCLSEWSSYHMGLDITFIFSRYGFEISIL
jgi:hypothetical protein